VSKSRPPKLPDPASSPRLTKTGRQTRDRPIYREHGGEDFGQWEVEVTPLVGASSTGRGIDAPEQIKRGVLFEVRAAFYGPGLPQFGSQPNTRMVPHTHTEDQELAVAIARTLTGQLRAGKREIDITQVARDVERNQS
jgi:hypothetical protein